MVFVVAETEEDVIKAIDEHEKIIVDFYTPSCHPCVIFEAVVKQLMEEYESINVVKVDARKFSKIVYRGNVIAEDVTAVPTIMFFENGVKSDTVVGYSDDIKEGIIEEWFKVQRVFLINFENDIYDFARVGDRIIELKTRHPSRRILTVKDKVFKLSKMWDDEEIDGSYINTIISPRRIGSSVTPATKWLIEEIK
jgi:thiol-disulfide isomerase/thioredoxin